jgi:poly [ADP-ribose] polymerase 2/3/4
MIQSIVKRGVRALLSLAPYQFKAKLHNYLAARHNPIASYSRQLQQLQAPLAGHDSHQFIPAQYFEAEGDAPQLEPLPAIETPKAQYRSCNLIMVSADNNNKFYQMSEKADGTFEVEYGRVGSQPTVLSYPISQWDAKYLEKVRKGYKDQSALFVEGNAAENGLEGISEPLVRQLLKQLRQHAQRSIGYHYYVHSDQVSVKQVQEAQNLLDQLMQAAKIDLDTKAFNAQLLELFAIIPRRMKNVKDFLVQKADDAADLAHIQALLAHEQSTLDVMRSQVEIAEKQKDASATPRSLLEIMGLVVKPVEEKSSIALIQQMMEDQQHRFVRAFEVRSLRSEKAFAEHLQNRSKQNTELFWHGSRNENWLSILENGLVLRPASAVISGKMFGYGLYFADRFQKSLNYSSIHGAYWSGGAASQAFLAIFKVHMGKALKIQKHEASCHDLDEQVLQQKGQFDSVFASRGADLVNNEYIVYNEKQCAIQYLVEIK